MPFRKELDKKKSADAADKQSEAWSVTMEIPCRRCTDENQGIEVCKPIGLFATAHVPSEIWSRIMEKGQDFCCYTCFHSRGWKRTDEVIPCDGCSKIQARKKFDAETQALWDSYPPSRDMRKSDGSVQERCNKECT